MRIRILVVDDEEDFRIILSSVLRREGYDVDMAESAEEALGMDLSVYQLMLVDIMMERLSGFDFVKQVRNNPATENIPVIFISALNGEYDKVMGLNIGGDDFITKPFNNSEVVARVRAVLRRVQPVQQPANPAVKSNYEPDITFKTLRLDRNDKTCFIDGKEVKLTRKEFELLLFFLTHRERIHSREEIMNNVWNTQVSDRAIDTNITRLRQKVGAYSENIVTRLGFGYGFKTEA